MSVAYVIRWSSVNYSWCIYYWEYCTTCRYQTTTTWQGARLLVDWLSPTLTLWLGSRKFVDQQETWKIHTHTHTHEHTHLHKPLTIYLREQSVAHPEGSANRRVWGANLLFGNIYAENLMKMKDIGPRGGHVPSCPTLGSITGNASLWL